MWCLLFLLLFAFSLIPCIAWEPLWIRERERKRRKVLKFSPAVAWIVTHSTQTFSGFFWTRTLDHFSFSQKLLWHVQVKYSSVNFRLPSTLWGHHCFVTNLWSISSPYNSTYEVPTYPSITSFIHCLWFHATNNKCLHIHIPRFMSCFQFKKSLHGNFAPCFLYYFVQWKKSVELNYIFRVLLWVENRAKSTTQI